MDLASALELGEEECVSFVGAGGKKTAMAELVREGTERDRSVGYTTTTHMPPPDVPLVVAHRSEIVERVQKHTPPVAFASRWVKRPERVPEKVRGFEPGVVDSLVGTFDWLAVKADGARQREFKTPGADEPVVPDRTTLVVVVASVQAVDEPLTAKRVHRPELTADLAGLAVGDKLTPAAAGAVLASEDGGLRKVPTGSDAVVMVNKADSRSARETATTVVEQTLSRSSRFAHGLVTSFRTETWDRIDP
jgi:probable selenium-dependent hydroxylase accessory protein YqeC